jgi:hypothetical protein
MSTNLFNFFRGDTLLGQIEVVSELCDFPWYGGRFTPTPAFADVAPLFAEELRLLDSDDFDAWDAVWQQIDAPGLRLVPVHGGVADTEPLIHIEGGEARWRS